MKDYLKPIETKIIIVSLPLSILNYSSPITINYINMYLNIKTISWSNFCPKAFKFLPIKLSTTSSSTRFNIKNIKKCLLSVKTNGSNFKISLCTFWDRALSSWVIKMNSTKIKMRRAKRQIKNMEFKRSWRKIKIN